MSMMTRAMGERFARLPRAVQRFHCLNGQTTLHGWVETKAPASMLGRLLAWCLGTPRRASSGPIRFQLEARAETESWTRHFPSQTMCSDLRLVGGQIEERLGLACLRFELDVVDRALRMNLVRMRFLAVPCPAWLLPRVIAEERGDDGQLHFHVEAVLPLMGVVASYRGHLDLPPEGYT